MASRTLLFTFLRICQSMGEIPAWMDTEDVIQRGTLVEGDFYAETDGDRISILFLFLLQGVRISALGAVWI